jgi:glucose-6-phosphate dehydrogenase assembly protein OpcA
MATTYKILGQAAVATSATQVDLYTVPSATEAVVSSIVVANRDSAAATYRISCAPAGASIANSQYVAFDVTVGGSDSTVLTLGITLAATDKIRVYGSTANLTFTAFGSEIS